MITEKKPMVWVLKEQMISGDSPRVMNFDPAMKFGDVHYVTDFDPPSHPASTALKVWTDSVVKFCEDYNDARDYIICTGRPTAIFVIGYYLAHWGKKPRLLVWNRTTESYTLVENMTEGFLEELKAKTEFLQIADFEDVIRRSVGE